MTGRNLNKHHTTIGNLLAAKMALRYLFSRKSHSAVGIIAIVSVCGIAVATMAIVCVLSVFNGFHSVISERDSRITPDVAITPAHGAYIPQADSLAGRIATLKGVACATPVVSDNAVAYHDGRQTPVTLTGVKPEEYREIIQIDSLLYSGTRYNLSYYDTPPPTEETELQAAEVAQIETTAAAEFDEAALFADIPADSGNMAETAPTAPHALLSIGIASRLGVDAGDISQNIFNGKETVGEGVIIFIPRRTATLNTINPTSSFMADSLAISGVYASDQSEFDSETVIVDIELARRLLEYDHEATAIYVAASKNTDPARLAEEISGVIGEDYVVKDRMEQQTLNFRMISIEKWVTFFILSFILLIASFNIISTLSMLIVEKKHNILTLTRIGASRRLIGRIFWWESIMVCTMGTLSGIMLGSILCLLQQHYGFIGMSGSEATLIVQSYPVRLQWSDILLVIIPSLGVAMLTASISAKFSQRFTAKR